MEIIEGEHIVGNSDRGTRKRKVNRTSRERKKQLRYSNHDASFETFDLVCTHKKANLKCKDITHDKMLQLRHFFFKDPNRNIQDNLLANMVTVEKPFRERIRKTRGKAHSVTVKYYVTVQKEKLQVCQKLFLAIYGITQRRVSTICRKVQNGEVIKNNRGGDRKSKKNENKLLAVKNFISTLKAKESHYGRSKSRRIYLSSEYSITALWKLYNKNCEENLKVNYKYFSRVFNNKFNIGFGTPATDVCGFCIRTQNSINISKHNEEKDRLKTELKVHKFRAKQFHKLMNETSQDALILSFDLQQVQVLPKIPIQEAFYAQQLSLYFFCITTPNLNNPIFYTWMEHQASRGATETCSALLQFLRSYEFPEGVTHIKLFADGCGGQNKNSHVVHLLMIWLHKFSPKTITKIELIFPVRGHSYLPPDRVFGRAEKLIRARNIIKAPEVYWEIYSSIGEVRKLGIDWFLVDIKQALGSFKKVTGISAAKRILIKKNSIRSAVLIKTETLYRNDDETKVFQSLLKPRKQLNLVRLPDMPLGRKIKKKKLDSLQKLLVSLAGSDWPKDKELQWLEVIFNNHSDDVTTHSDDEISVGAECECDNPDNLSIL